MFLIDFIILKHFEL